MDPRVKKLAKLLINYSLKLKKGQLLKIRGEQVSMPLIIAAYEEALKLGAHPFVQIINPELEEKFYKLAKEHQLKFVSPLAKYEIEKIDALLAIWGTINSRTLSGVDSQKQVANRKVHQSIMKKFFKYTAEGRISWVGTQYPTYSDAQEADMSLTEYEDFVYQAGHLTSGDPVKYWTKVKKEQDRLVKILNKVDRIHVQSADADLKLRVKGRKWINCAGTENFPDGEVFTCPLEDTAEGFIRYSFPAIFASREVEDIRFEFKKGKVVNEKAGKNQEFLTNMLNIDKGGRYLGEFAIGTNYDIKKFTKNILFDEKIGGTCHLAIGASIPEAGGKNLSAIHWDMICDLKKNSEITADGKLIYKNGKFTI